MKRILLLSLFGALCFSGFAQKIKVTVDKPGTLATLLTPEQMASTKHLVVKGQLGGADVRLIRKMAGRDLNGSPVKGALTRLDMRGVTFVNDGIPYGQINNEPRTLGPANQFPDYIFHACQLEEIKLPEQTEFIGYGALALTGLRRIELPENVTIANQAFYGDSLLTEVVFPRMVKSIYPNSFAQTGVRHLRINNLRYSAMGAFRDMPKLVSAEIKGTSSTWTGIPSPSAPSYAKYISRATC